MKRRSPALSHPRKTIMQQLLLDDGQFVNRYPKPDKAENDAIAVESYTIPLVWRDDFKTVHRGTSDFHGCYFNLVTHGSKSREGLGAYRHGCECCGGDEMKIFRGHLGDEAPVDGKTELIKTASLGGTQGEDPRCFAWGKESWCLTWTKMHGDFKLVRLDDGHVISLDPRITSSIGGKNWIPVAANDGALYIAVQIAPLMVLKYNGEDNGVGQLSWHAGEPGLRNDLVQMRGGAPAAFSEDLNAYVGLGHVTVDVDNHLVYAYLFSPDMLSSSVAKVQMPEKLMSTYCDGGIWDPFSLDKLGPDDGNLFSVQHSGNMNHFDKAPVFNNFLFSLDSKNVLPASFLHQEKDKDRNSSSIADTSHLRSATEVLKSWANDKARQCSKLQGTALIMDTDLAFERINTLESQLGAASNLIEHGMMPLAFSISGNLSGDESWVILDDGTVTITSIFYLCVAMYGCLIILWAIAYASNLMKEGSAFHTCMLCLTFCSMALGMNVLNKILVTALSAPCLITAIQMLSTVSSLVIFSFPKLMEIQAKHKMWLAVPLVFTGMLITSLFSYQSMNLSMYTIVRNLAPMVCLPIEVAVMPAGKGPTITPGMIASLVIMLIGAIFFSFDKMAFTIGGLFFVAGNMVLGISDRLIQRRLLTEECKDLPTEACAFLNNFFGMVPAILAASLIGEVTIGEVTTVTGTKLAKWRDPQVLFLLILSCAIGLGISYFGLATQRAVSATSVMVLQNVQRIAVILIGVTFFGDSISSWHAMLGVFLSITGSLWYSKIQVDIHDQQSLKEGKKSNV